MTFDIFKQIELQPNVLVEFTTDYYNAGQADMRSNM